MDQENNTAETNRPARENPFKKKGFYIAFFFTAAILFVSPLLIQQNGGDHWSLTMLILCIPYAFVGLIIWALVRKRSRPVALGILLGGVSPFIAVFLVTGGCGLVMF